MMRLRIFVVAVAGIACLNEARARLPEPLLVILPLPVPAPAPKHGSRKQPVPPKPAEDPASWVTTNDYPSRSLRNVEDGTTTFRLEINPSGQVIGCIIVATSGHPALDAKTCQLMIERGRFLPGLNAGGKPIAGTWSSRTRWVIPERDVAIRLTPDSIVSTFVIEKDGIPSNCRTTKNGVEIVDISFRNACIHGAKYTPYVDEQGNPIRKQVTLIQALSVSDLPK